MGIIGKRVDDLDLPDETILNAIVREGRIINTNEQTNIIAGDFHYFLVPNEHKEKLKQELEKKRNKDI